MATGQRTYARGGWRSALSLVLTVAPLAACGGDPLAQLALGSPADAAIVQTQIIRVLTYNVAGLPEELVPSSASRNNALISPLLNDYDLVLLQEDFAYHGAIVAASSYRYASTPDPTARALGDGLTMLSTSPFTDFQRVTWNDCFGVMDSGSDCLTPKGFTFARLTVGTLGAIDIYNVHTDAGYGSRDVEARHKNLQQLADAILTLSADRPVIVAGDFNGRYHDGDIAVQSFLTAIPHLRDAWAAAMPVNLAERPCSTSASDPLHDANDPACERLDKIFYRGTDDLTLTPIGYQVEGAKFIDDAGRQLSDHRPVSVIFSVSS
jgi:endonuclease/exonuclease/phosphatase family metal-dependent hydrolase